MRIRGARTSQLVSIRNFHRHCHCPISFFLFFWIMRIFRRLFNSTSCSSLFFLRYRAPFTEKPWIDKFKHVIGIIHTNYLVYTRGYTGGAFKEPMLYYVNQGMCRANCHKIIKLSGEDRSVRS